MEYTLDTNQSDSDPQVVHTQVGVASLALHQEAKLQPQTRTGDSLPGRERDRTAPGSFHALASLLQKGGGEGRCGLHQRKASWIGERMSPTAAPSAPGAGGPRWTNTHP